MNAHQLRYRERKAMRELVEVSPGEWRMVATHLPEWRHGQATTYTHWACRCVSCTRARSNHYYKHVDSNRAYARAYAKAHPEAARERNARWLAQRKAKKAAR